MQTPILSICIPTYNRINSLRCLLRSIYECNANVALETYEVVVTDNCSADNTIELLRQYSSEFSNFTYAVNDENIGAIPNFRKCLQLAKGEFVWLVGSDDLLVNSKLNYITNNLLMSNCDIALLNCFSWNPTDKQSSEIFNTHVVEQKKIVASENPIIGNVLTDFLAIQDGFLTAMYSFVVRRCLWQNPLKTYDSTKHPFSNAKNCSAHVFDIVPATKNKKAVYLNEPVILASFNTSWGEYYPVFYSLIIPSLYNLYEQFSDTKGYLRTYLQKHTRQYGTYIPIIARNTKLWNLFSVPKFILLHGLNHSTFVHVRQLYFLKLKSSRLGAFYRSMKRKVVK